MSSARHQLILLGLVCQGLSWDNFAAPLLYALLWAACLRLPRRPARMGQAADVSAIILGGVLAWQLAPVFGASAHFAIGHGLALLQLLRLRRPLDRREKLFSLIVAVGHLAVACTVILDYRFILLLGAMLVLLPRALMELELDSSPATPGITGPIPRLGLAVGVAIFAVMAAVFVLVPRGFLGTPFAARLPGGSQRPSGARISARYDLADGADVAFADVRSLLTTLMRTSATHAEFEAVVRPAFNLTECVCAYLSHPHGKAELE